VKGLRSYRHSASTITKTCLRKEELIEEPETFDEDFVGSDEEEEIGLDEIDQDVARPR
jgi:hypothetical protein